MMQRSTIVYWLFILSLAAAGCTASAPGPASDTSVPAPADGPAAAAFRECRANAPADKIACYEPILLSRLGSDGVEATMAMLDELGALDADVKRDGHVYAHAIGLAAYTSADEAGQRFAECTPIFQSGCYHGVIQAYFMDSAGGGSAAEVDSAAVNRLCSDQRGAGGDRWLLFQCAHGMGHGLVMLYDHDLPRALGDCDLLTDPWERNACLGGAFMENIVNATAPHHSAEGLVHDTHAPDGEQAGGDDREDHGEHSEHQDHHAAAGSAGASGAPFRALDPDDPHHPCSALAAKYLTACYQMQTSAVLFRNDGNMTATMEFCDGAPERVRHTCYQSLGRDISGYTVQNVDESIRLCSRADPRYQVWCHIGVVKNFVDVTADATDGLAYCRAMPEGEDKARCYQAVGEQIWVLESEAEEREEMCRAAGPAFIDACRRGAGLGEVGSGNAEVGPNHL